MTLKQPRPHSWQLVVHRIAASRAGAWILSSTLHHLDRLFFDVFKGQLSPTTVLAGLPIVLLTTIGAKTGKARTVPVSGFSDGDDVILIASNYGKGHYPAWYHNLRVTPIVMLSIRERKKSYMAREATDTERDEYWRGAFALFPSFLAYRQRAAERDLPIIVLSPQ
jgi:deazaflavin-dependent oxidoreductase (nitroreductase family)